MAGKAGYTSRVYFNGHRISPYLNSLELGRSYETAEVSTMESIGKKYVATKSDATFSLEGWWEDTVDTIFEGVFDGTEANISFYPNGSTKGNVGKLAKVIQTEYSASTEQSGAVGLSVSTQGTELCKSIVSLVQESTYTSTVSTPSLDGTASSADGGYAVIHVTDVTGTFDVIVEDSADDSSWSTLASFTSITAIGSEILTIAGTIDRYTRITISTAGTTISLQAGINRG